MYYMEPDPDKPRTLAGRGWWPRRQALAQSLLAATRAGRFPNLRSIRIEPSEQQEAEYQVKVEGKGTDEDEDSMRTITLKALCAEELIGKEENDNSIVVPAMDRKPPGYVEVEGEAVESESDGDELDPNMDSDMAQRVRVMQNWEKERDDEDEGEQCLPLSLLLSLA